MNHKSMTPTTTQAHSEVIQLKAMRSIQEENKSISEFQKILDSQKFLTPDFKTQLHRQIKQCREGIKIMRKFI